METYLAYQDLIKPFFAPPSYVFSPVWTILYILMVISFFLILKNIKNNKLPHVINYILIANIVFNFSFTPLMFKLNNLFLATIDIYLVLISIIWLFFYYKDFKKNKLEYLLFLNVPYLIWVSFATLLQTSIFILNF